MADISSLNKAQPRTEVFVGMEAAGCRKLEIRNLLAINDNG